MRPVIDIPATAIRLPATPTVLTSTTNTAVDPPPRPHLPESSGSIRLVVRCVGSGLGACCDVVIQVFLETAVSLGENVPNPSAAIFVGGRCQSFPTQDPLRNPRSSRRT